MISVCLMRHGVAESLGAKQDHERCLTVQGEQALHALVKRLEDVTFDVIVHSPYVRTSQTAAILSALLSDKTQLHAVDELASGATPETILRVLKNFPQQKILVIGHQPDLGNAVTRLLSLQSKPVMGLRPGTMVFLDFIDRIESHAGMLRNVFYAE